MQFPLRLRSSGGPTFPPWHHLANKAVDITAIIVHPKDLSLRQNLDRENTLFG